MTVLEIIARVHTDFDEKFGIPRQSGLVDSLQGTIVFEPKYRNRDAVRGLTDFSHIWLLWQFSESVRDTWSPTVRPPRLGGNRRVGVFATRSPFRPNPIGLSSVRLCKVEPDTPNGPILHIAGCDLMDGTPIYDIKPYLPFTDSHPDAVGGFAEEVMGEKLTVTLPEILPPELNDDQIRGLYDLLAQDPRPAYQDDPDRRYGLRFAGFEVFFRVQGDHLTVEQLQKRN
ncbi:MAG: tRNA (N6-threonylcarbamoyladenosine(37)-N6)-methyltransferase TrmO [Clostridia bacterium]|nr:tRNA (N6-threonylcarbamoyladenosine(37)-N6)-methyltransferase TrmO [Clostridia bacterium]